jgi:hypothetical protein
LQDYRIAGLQEGGLPEGGLPEGGLPEGRLPEGRLPEGRLREGELREGRLQERTFEHEDTQRSVRSFLQSCNPAILQCHVANRKLMMSPSFTM